MNQKREVPTRTAQLDVCSAAARGAVARRGRKRLESFMVGWWSGAGWQGGRREEELERRGSAPDRTEAPTMHVDRWRAGVPGPIS